MITPSPSVLKNLAHDVLDSGLNSRAAARDIHFLFEWKAREGQQRAACQAPLRRLHVLKRPLPLQRLDVEDLWIQSKVRDGHVELLKIKGADNPADILTKYVSAEILIKMLGKLNLIFMDGRSPVAPELPPERR